MLDRLRRSIAVLCWLIGCSLATSCQPTRDLDATTWGTSRPTDDAGASSSSGAGGLNALDPGGASGTAPAGGTIAQPSGGAAETLGGSDPAPGSGGAGAGEGGEASAGAGGFSDSPLGELPNELSNSPVQGMLTLSEVIAAGDKAFRIVGPLATYEVTASSGNITTLEDRSGGNVVRWVGPGSRRTRRAGIVTTPQPVMSTSVDEASFTARHVRLLSASPGAWAWVWDFYVTQATLTITKAAGTYAFTFSGTPGDQLTSADNVVQASGVGQSAVSSLLEDLSGAVEWAYITDATYGHSLFLVQHDDDDLAERYDAVGGDTATWVFGDGQSLRAQRRFSLGFLASAVHSDVAKRVQFVIDAIP